MNFNAVTVRASHQSIDAIVDMIVKMELTRETAKANVVQESSVARLANVSAKAENVTNTLTVAMEVTRMIAVSFNVLALNFKSRSISVRHCC